MQYVDLHEVEGCWVVVVNLLKCLRPSPASLSGGTEREEAERRVRGGGARREREEGGGGGGGKKREGEKEGSREMSKLEVCVQLEDYIEHALKTAL